MAHSSLEHKEESIPINAFGVDVDLEQEAAHRLININENSFRNNSILFILQNVFN